jgi:hypothetical protein
VGTPLCTGPVHALLARILTGQRQRALGREHALYALGAAGVGVHAVDHLVSDPEWGFLFTSAVLLAALTIVAVGIYPWLRPWVRETAALSLGLMWAVAAGVHHVGGLFVGGAAPTDYTGIPAAIGGALMVAAGVRADAVRRRSATPVTAGQS